MGKTVDLTPRKSAKIQILLQEGYSGKDIVEKVNVSASSVSRIPKKICGSKELTAVKKGRCGRKRKTTGRDDSFLVRECKKNRKKTSKQLWTMMSERGVNVSARTVRRRLLTAVMHACRPLKKQKSHEADES